MHEPIEVYLEKRNDVILEISGRGGDEEARKLWKKLKGYHRRLLAEKTMYRINQITGSHLRSRKLEK